MGPFSFIRFEDSGVKPFAASSASGNLLAKTPRIKEWEKQSGNPIIQYPFGLTDDGSGGVNSPFANDLEYDQTGTFNLAPETKQDALNPLERAVIDFYKNIILQLFAGQSVASILAYAATIEPNRYSVDYTTISGQRIDVFCIPNNLNNRTFSLCLSAQSSGWFAQWFISSKGDTNLTSLYSEYGNVDLPLPLDVDGFSFQSVFYDLDFAVFPDPNLVKSDMPLHSFDTIRFNVIPSEVNLTGKNSALIGMMDCDGDTTEGVGEIEYPACLQDTNFTLTIGASSFTPMLSSIISNSADSKIEGLDSFGNQVFLITVPFADTDTGNITDYASSIINYINALGPYTASFTIFPNLVFVIRVDDYTTQAVSIEPVGILAESYAQGSAIDRCTCFTQMQGTINVPGGLIQGKQYQFYIYDGDGIYSFSNVFELNDFETFSQVVSFSGTGTIQGFEYADNWSQQIRILLHAGAPSPEITDTEYRDSRGNYRRPSIKSDLSLNLQTGWIDEPTLNALIATTQHSRLVLGQKSIYVNGEIEVGHPQDFTTDSSYFGLAQATFKALIQNYQPIDNGCTNC